MKHIQVINLSPEAQPGRDKELKELFSHNGCRVIEINIRGGAVLTKHKARGPITVQCLRGSGAFLAGAELEDQLDLRPGTLLSLDAEVEHEVRAETDLHLLLTKFEI